MIAIKRGDAITLLIKKLTATTLSGPRKRECVSGHKITGAEPTENSSGYMLDATEFNAVAKGYVDISAYAGLRLFATHAQRDELNGATSEPLKARLRAVFEEIAPEKILTESAVWDVSRWDEAKSSEDGLFQRMLVRLKELDTREKLFPNQHRDILIAETAIKNGLTLVSDDRRLRKVTEEFGGKTLKPPRTRHAEDGGG